MTDTTSIETGKSWIAYFEIADSVPTEHLDEAGVDATQAGWTTLCIQTAPRKGNHEPPEVGYRLLERNENREHRPGPWIVMGAPQCYAAARNCKHDLIYIYECDYQPLESPEEWTAPIRRQVPAHVAKEIGMEIPEQEAQLV